jgi:hypothetical protein
MAREITLRYDGESTVEADNLGQLNGTIKKLTDANRTDGNLIVRAGSLRWRGGGVWLSISAEYQTDTDSIDTAEQSFAGVIVDAGFEATEEDAIGEMNVV